MTDVKCGNTDCFNNDNRSCTLDEITLWLPKEDESLLYCSEYESEDVDEED